MTDFEADAGEFRGWKSNHPEKRKWLLNSLLDQIITHVPTIIGFSESHEENGLEFKTTYRKGIVDSMVHFSWESLTEAAPFALVYAKHPQYSSNLIEKHFEAVGQHEAGLRTFAVQEPMGISPLRAADIVAYELSRHERNDRPERYPFTRLKQGVRSMKLI